MFWYSFKCTLVCQRFCKFMTWKPHSQIIKWRKKNCQWEYACQDLWLKSFFFFGTHLLQTGSILWDFSRVSEWPFLSSPQWMDHACCSGKPQISCLWAQTGLETQTKKKRIFSMLDHGKMNRKYAAAHSNVGNNPNWKLEQIQLKKKIGNWNSKFEICLNWAA